MKARMGHLKFAVTFLAALFVALTLAAPLAIGECSSVDNATVAACSAAKDREILFYLSAMIPFSVAAIWQHLRGRNADALLLTAAFAPFVVTTAAMFAGLSSQ